MKWIIARATRRKAYGFNNALKIPMRVLQYSMQRRPVRLPHVTPLGVLVRMVKSIVVTPSIRLLALDIDGTLLNSQFQISEVDLTALRRAREVGMEVVLVTGRRHDFA